MTIERVIELLSRDYWFEDAELKEAKRIAVEILKEHLARERFFKLP